MTRIRVLVCTVCGERPARCRCTHDPAAIANRRELADRASRWELQTVVTQPQAARMVREAFELALVSAERRLSTLDREQRAAVERELEPLVSELVDGNYAAARARVNYERTPRRVDRRSLTRGATVA